MKVLSLFDGMSCGYLAMIAAGIQVDRYDAWEIDKYAVQASKHNFPQIMHHGDVFEADFTEYQGYDFLVGGSPCTYWSIAQSPDKRETTASGLGWDLFSQYVRALHEAQPRMFIYENNKSMSKDIRASITETFGFEPICINSALVSAQNRQRLYWVGVRNADGTYRKASIEQPEDRGILLKDVLDSAVARRDKSYGLTASYSQSATDALARRRNTQVAEPVGIKPLGGLNNSHQRRIVYDVEGKTPTLVAGMGTGGGNTPLVSEAVMVNPITGEPMRVPEATKKGYVDINPGECVDLRRPNSKTRRGRRMEDKSNCLIAQEPEFYEYMGAAACRQVGRRVGEDGHRHDNDKGVPHFQRLEVNDNSQQTNALTTVSKDNLIAEPVALQEQPFGRKPDENGQYDRRYEAKTDGKSPALTSVDARRIVAEPIRVGTMPSAEGRQGGGQAMRIYDPDGKSTTLKANAGGGGGGGKTGLYATQEKDAKGQRVHTVQDGQIEVNGKRDPIKLRDGKYIIRKLTVTECMRLQTVPEWYDFSCVSNTQAYKMLGNGWTVEVIAHLIRGAIKSSLFGI